MPGGRGAANTMESDTNVIIHCEDPTVKFNADLSVPKFEPCTTKAAAPDGGADTGLMVVITGCAP